MINCLPTMNSATLKVQVSKGSTILPRNIARLLLNYKLQLPTRALCVLGVQGPAGKNRSHHSGKRRLYNRGMEEYARHSSDSTGHLLVYTCPILTRNAQVWQSQCKMGIVTRNSYPLRMRVRVMSPSKPLRPARMIAEGKRNLEWTEQEGDDKHQL